MSWQLRARGIRSLDLESLSEPNLCNSDRTSPDRSHDAPKNRSRPGSLNGKRRRNCDRDTDGAMPRFESGIPDRTATQKRKRSKTQKSGQHGKQAKCAEKSVYERGLGEGPHGVRLAKLIAGDYCFWLCAAPEALLVSSIRDRRDARRQSTELLTHRGWIPMSAIELSKLVLRFQGHALACIVRPTSTGRHRHSKRSPNIPKSSEMHRNRTCPRRSSHLASVLKTGGRTSAPSTSSYDVANCS